MARRVRIPRRIVSLLDHLTRTRRGLRAAPRVVTARTPGGCEECLRDGTRWVHLRLCLSCGHVGCCDSSVGKHAAAHYAETGDPVMRSLEPGEAWRWCFADDLLG